MEFDSFATRVKQLRKEKGITQEILADDLGITKGTVSVWERGIRTPERSTIKEVADYFDVAVSYLLGYSDTKQVYIEDTEQECWKKSERIDAAQSLTEMFVRLTNSSFSVIGAAIEEAFKQEKNKGLLEDEGKYFVKIDSMAIVEANAQLEGMEDKQL